MKRRHLRGFSLLEMLIALTILTILATTGIGVYQSIIEKTQLENLRAALLENYHFVQQWRLQKMTRTPTAEAFSSTTWPVLPVSETKYFTLGFTAKKPDSDWHTKGFFRIEAIPKMDSPWHKKLLVYLDQDGNIQRCDPKTDTDVSKCVLW